DEQREHNYNYDCDYDYDYNYNYKYYYLLDIIQQNNNKKKLEEKYLTKLRNFYENNNYNNNIFNIIDSKQLNSRFINRVSLSKTLQGDIYKAKDIQTNNNVVVKVAYDISIKSTQSINGKIIG